MVSLANEDRQALRSMLIETLGLDWRGMSGEPDGCEVADDCLAALLPKWEQIVARHVAEARAAALNEAADLARFTQPSFADPRPYIAVWAAIRNLANSPPP